MQDKLTNKAKESQAKSAPSTAGEPGLAGEPNTPGTTDGAGETGTTTGCHPERSRRISPQPGTTDGALDTTDENKRVSVALDQDQSTSSDDALASEQDIPEAEEKKKRKRRLLILLLLLLAFLCAGFGVWYAFNQPTDDGMEPNVIVGPMENMTDEELQKLLDDKLAEGMLGFSINTGMVFDSPEAEGNILFENPVNNAKLTKIEITRDDNGELVYSTGFLSPGSYVEKDTLDVPLESGSYKCTAVVSSYREESKEFIGKAAAEVTITVK